MSEARPNCSLCPPGYMAKPIEQMLSVGMPIMQIARVTREKGSPVSANAVRRHLHVCLNNKRPVPDTDEARVTSRNPYASKVHRDLATLVVERTTELVLKGHLTPTLRDGLSAQALIDRRSEKEQDRKFMLGLARLLSGAGGIAPAEMIEGRVVDVTPTDNPLLAPASLRADE